MTEPFTVAIDGPAASGKGTIARALAQRFRFAHLDTGLLYRRVGAAMLTGADPIRFARAFDPGDLSDPSLRTPEVAQAASKVAAIPEVRAALLDFQRAFARRSGGAVLDGRDIGTVVCPDADVKLYITASPRTRAQRRFNEANEKGSGADYETILKDIILRDERDMNREDSPLKPAADAHLIDTSEMSIETAFETAFELVEKAISEK